MTAPDSIKQLVERFDMHRDAYRAGKYNETQLRNEFLNPFFEALGWDVLNRQGNAEEYKHVIHEDSLEIEGAKKAPDYAFKIGRERKFFVEAKKPSVKIETNPEVAFQLKRYVWSAKLPLGILTDFEEFAIYECRSKPKVSDSVKTGRVLLLNYTDYIEKWDEIAAIFSHEAVMTGGFDKFANTAAKKKGTAEVDAAFLAEIEGWREALAKNVALRNKQRVKNEADLNYAVQMTIDRMIFLRICEDRGYEPENQLQGIATPPPPSLRDTSPKFDGKPRASNLGEEGRVYSELKKLFERADRRYNSGLFHFKNENGRGRADTFTTGLAIDDKVLKDIIRDLYYPSPYVFAVIPADILGQIYEQFLGKVIKLTAGGNAKVEEKPEVRKAGGVYYTPTFIVSTIVINTLGKLLNPTPPLAPPQTDSTFREGKMTPKEAALLKILDPACGSGTFLLGAYQYLLDWHLDWYLNNDFEKWSKGKNAVLVQSKEGWKLSVEKKKEILLNNIYGVDIDPQAVEVTKLSLLLKVIEDPGQLSYLDERILPDLGRNIQCGNSLIGRDYFEGQLMVSEEEERRVNAFDWKAAFPEVFARGGFDVVIGNPPWGAEFTQVEKEYFRNIYDEFHVRTPESFNYFVAKMWKLTSRKGLVGVIIPSSFLNQHEFWKTRKFLVETSIFSRVYNLGDGVFIGVTAPSCILLFGKEIRQESPLFFDFRKNDRDDLPVLLQKEENGLDATSIGQDSESFILQIRSGGNVIQKCYKYPTLRDIAEDVATGVSSGLDAAFIHKKDDAEKIGLENSILRKLIIGGEINRYSLTPQSQKLIIYATKEIDIKDFPNCYVALEKYRDRLKDRVETKSGIIPWYSLYRPRRKKLFELPKILVRQTADRIMACIDYDSWYCLKSGIIIQLPENAEIAYHYLLGLLNSRLIKFLYDDLVGEQARVFPEVKPVQLFKLPIHPINFSDPAEKARHDKMVSLVERMLALHKSLKSAHNPQEADRLAREVESVDKAIDNLVYQLYGLSEEEIGIVEG